MIWAVLTNDPRTGPRNRAPLGNKTTNAKARALQTSAGKEGALKPKTNGKSSTTQNVKKAAPEVQPPQRQIVSKPQEEEVPDVEYAPPKPKGRSAQHPTSGV